MCLIIDVKINFNGDGLDGLIKQLVLGIAIFIHGNNLFNLYVLDNSSHSLDL